MRICARVCEGCVSRVHRGASGADIEPTCGELWREGGWETGLTLSSQGSADYRCPPPPLFIWCKPEKGKKKGGRFADLTGCSGCCNRKKC